MNYIDQKFGISRLLWDLMVGPVEIIAAYKDESQDEGEYEDYHGGHNEAENTGQSTTS